jgi:uncharacterized membrane protein
MADNSEYNQDKAAKELSEYVLARMKQGKDKGTIAAEMRADGAVHEEADRVAGQMYDAIMESARKEQFTSDSWQPALLGGLGAAVLGGIVWGLAMIFTGFESGIAAWGLGWFCGWAVVKLTGGRKGIQSQVVAVGSSILGILIGKYIAFYDYLSQVVLEDYGAEAAEDLSIFSLATVEEFFLLLWDMLDPIDFLFVGAAVYTAWGLTRGLGVKVPETGIPPGLIK